MGLEGIRFIFFYRLTQRPPFRSTEAPSNSAHLV
jgi:hypothetical protein